MTTTNNPLSQIAGAEASVVHALNAAAAALDSIGTSSLDQAMARLQASAAAAKDRLAGAAALLGLAVADVVGTFTGTAAQIVAALAVNDVKPVQPAALPAPVAPVTNPSTTQPGDDVVIDLAAELPPPVDEGPAQQPQQDAQQAHQDCAVHRAGPAVVRRSDRRPDAAPGGGGGRQPDRGDGCLLARGGLDQRPPAHDRARPSSPPAPSVPSTPRKPRGKPRRGD